MEVSNADRVIYPDTGTTKGEVVAYYLEAAPLMLPFVAGRALTVERYPKGLGEKGFMQKNAPEHFSDQLIRRHHVQKEGGGTTTYPVVDDAEAIAEFANLGVITFHAPSATIDDEWHPDWAIWDLDPPPGRFDLARRAATELRSILSSFGVEVSLMTSGSNGYHLRAPLDRSADFEVVSEVTRGTAALGEVAHPDLMTLAFRKKDRGDRVFVDWLRNAPYSTSVVPWSLRPRPTAPVATPLAWEELEDVDPNGVTIETAPGRFDDDPWGDLDPIDMTETAGAVSGAVDDAGIVLQPFDRFRS